MTVRAILMGVWVGLVGCLDPVAPGADAWDTGESPDATQGNNDLSDAQVEPDTSTGPTRDAGRDTDVEDAAHPSDGGMADAASADMGQAMLPTCPPEGGMISFTFENDVVQALCEADGWLLVAYSAPAPIGEFETFGWTVRRGSPTDRTRAYSLGVPVRFTQMRVVAEGTEGRGTKVMNLELPNGFVGDYGSSAVEPIWRNSNNLACMGLPQMFSWTGHTENTSSYWFRDSSSYDSAYGLFADGWHMNYDTCEQAGGYNNLQGAIYVRALAR